MERDLSFVFAEVKIGKNLRFFDKTHNKNYLQVIAILPVV